MLPLPTDRQASEGVAASIYERQRLFHLARGEYEVVIKNDDRWVRNPQSPLVEANLDHYGDFQNAADLLKHLQMHGQDVGDRWDAVADTAESRIGNRLAPLSRESLTLAGKIRTTSPVAPPHHPVTRLRCGALPRYVRPNVQARHG